MKLVNCNQILGQFADENYIANPEPIVLTGESCDYFANLALIPPKGSFILE